ncbi:MAG: hypothetical protein GY814_08120 [Gammaproteobacteria bacterium]|nr:hypothetical protein [Gammaproteobacteria bacterium]
MPIFNKWIVSLVILCCVHISQAVATETDEGIFAEINTSKGKIVAKLFYQQAPITVMNFIGLSDGSQKWQDAQGKEQSTPLYKGLTFHRTREFMVQTGDPTGEGAGGPGYVFLDEIHPDLSHSKAGMLSMANRGPNTNGSQFFITTKPANWLDGHYTMFGQVVSGMDVVGEIVLGDSMDSISIKRVGSEAVAFDITKAHKYSEETRKRRRELNKKSITEQIGEADPARVPQNGQEQDEMGIFDFIVIGHTEMNNVERLGIDFYYDHKGALEIANKLVSLARSKGVEFKDIKEKYSDLKRQSGPRKVENVPSIPTQLKAIFHLKPGQISGPIDLPTGIYIFKRSTSG